MIVPTERQRKGLDALLKMSWTLVSAFTAALELGSRHCPSSSFTIELFLCGLYLRQGKRALKYFDTQGAYKSMEKELCGTDVEEPFLRRLVVSLTRRNAVSIAVRFDEQFVDVLCEANRLRSEARRRKIELRDFMRALAMNRNAVEALALRRGLALKAPLP